MNKLDPISPDFEQDQTIDDIEEIIMINRNILLSSARYSTIVGK